MDVDVPLQGISERSSAESLHEPISGLYKVRELEAAKNVNEWHGDLQSSNEKVEGLPEPETVQSPVLIALGNGT